MLAVRNFPTAEHITTYCNQVNLLKGIEVSLMWQDCLTKTYYRAILKNGKSYIIMDTLGDCWVADSLVKVHNFIS